MRIPRLFLTENIAIGHTITLSREQSHYLKNVLRRKNNDPIVIFNDEATFSATINYINSDVEIMPLEKITEPPHTTIKKHLFQAACQHKKMDLIIQKTTELGIDSVNPIMAHRCKVNLQNSAHKAERWQQIAARASEQSQRHAVPIINKSIQLADISFSKDDCNLLLSPTGTTSMTDIPKPTGNVNIFLGPEGGFTKDEENHLVNSSCHNIKFGPRVMRTETAAIAITAAINVLWGDSS